MTIQISAFRSVPEFAQGYVKDLRVRWALEEAGLPYEALLIGGPETPLDYPRWQPFGQVPAYRDGEVELFESGAIVLHIAAKSEVLAPKDPAGRARVSAWVIAALNSIEPFAQNWLQLGAAPEAKALRPQLEAILDRRLSALQAWLGDQDYLEGRFTAGDLIMTMVLRELVEDGVLARYPALDGLRKRCEARPAFSRAFEAHMAPFREHAPA
jgi:glutathione S-transferase